MKLCADTLEARAAAFEEAADHLELKWTDDVLEFSQGKIVAEGLRKQAAKLKDLADERK